MDIGRPPLADMSATNVFFFYFFPDIAFSMELRISVKKVKNCSKKGRKKGEKGKKRKKRGIQGEEKEGKKNK